jgi:hypothetical protein
LPIEAYIALVPTLKYTTRRSLIEQVSGRAEGAQIRQMSVHGAHSCQEMTKTPRQYVFLSYGPYMSIYLLEMRTPRTLEHDDVEKPDYL